MGSEPLVKLGSFLDIGTELARDKAFDWAIVTTEDLGERIQALAIAMAELVCVEEVDRGGAIGFATAGKRRLSSPDFGLGGGI